MKRIAVVVAGAALFGGQALAQTETRRLYGADGSSLGRIETDNRGTQRLYDAAGRSKGRAERESDGSLRIYDWQGRSLGRVGMDAPDLDKERLVNRRR